MKRLQELGGSPSLSTASNRALPSRQAGEIRILVQNERISDDESVILAKDIAKKIESELTYPGQIKVTVIRETRVTDFAR